MRRVEYFEYATKTNDGNPTIKKSKIGEATFHQFGVDYEEFETGPGNFTTAILELDDGNVISVDVELIRFINAPIDQVKDLISNGLHINAIKRHRELFSSSLNDAKDACKKLKDDMELSCLR